MLTISNLKEQIEPIKDKLPKDLKQGSYDRLIFSLDKFGAERTSQSSAMNEALQILSDYCYKHELIVKTTTNPIMINKFEQLFEQVGQAEQEETKEQKDIKEHLKQIEDSRLQFSIERHKIIADRLLQILGVELEGVTINRELMRKIEPMIEGAKTTTITRILTQLLAFQQAKETCLNLLKG